MVHNLSMSYSTNRNKQRVSILLLNRSRMIFISSERCIVSIECLLCILLSNIDEFFDKKEEREIVGTFHKKTTCHRL